MTAAVWLLSRNRRVVVSALSSSSAASSLRTVYFNSFQTATLAPHHHHPYLLYDHSRSRRRTAATRRRTVATAASIVPVDEEEETLLHPDQLGPIQPPKALSPSAINEFKSCPQSYLFQYIYGLRQPTNTALAQGSMCHTALEQVFDLPTEHRTVQVLQNLFRRTWSEHRTSEAYRHLFANDRDAEAAWGKRALALLENYAAVEDPARVPRPNPMHREVWVRSNLTVTPTAGVTGYTATTTTNTTNTTTTSSSDDNDTGETFLVRGIMDRLDMVSVDDKEQRRYSSSSNEEPVVLRLIDYYKRAKLHLA